MDKYKKFWIAGLASIIIVTSVSGQEKKDKTATTKDEKSQEIIIRKKGGKTEKMTIVVEGDNVTINGKPVDEFKNSDVTVLKRDRLIGASPDMRRFRNANPSFNDDAFDLAPAHTNKAMLGVMTEKAGDDGVLVKDVTKESGAEKAGLKKGDVITKVGSRDIKDPEDLVEAIGDYKPDDKVDITYKRDGKENKTSVTLGEHRFRAYSFNFDDRNFNFNVPVPPVPPLEDNLRFNFNRRARIGLQIQDIEEGKGVTVKDVDDDSPAAKAGFKEGDVITQVNGKEVTGVDELRTEIRDIKDGDTVKFTYKRDGKNQTVDIKIPKRLKSADL